MSQAIKVACLAGILASACVSSGTYNAKVAELDQLKAKDKEAADQAKQLQAQIDELKGQLTDSQSKLGDLQKQLDSATAERDAAKKEADDVKAPKKKVGRKTAKAQ